MALIGITDRLSSSPEIARVLEGLRDKRAFLSGPVGSAKSACLASVIRGSKKPSLVIAANFEEADRIFRELKYFLRGGVSFFSSPDTIPFERLSPSKDSIAGRLEVLAKLSEAPEQVVVAPLKAVISRTLPPKLFRASIVSVKKGAPAELKDLSKKLVFAGYKRGDIVGERGEFSVRGGILDIFPSTGEHPVRIDLFGDIVEKIKLFDVHSQRSMSEIEEVSIYPSREMVLSDESVLPLGLVENKDEDIEKLLRGEYFEGMEFYLPLLYDKSYTLLDHMPEGSFVALIGELSLSEKSLFDEAESARREGVLADKAPLYKPYLSLNDLYASIDGKPTLSLLSEDPLDGEAVHMDLKNPMSFVRERDLAIKEIGDASRENVIVVSKHSHRVVELFSEAGLTATYLSDLQVLPNSGITVVPGELSSGFSWPSGRLLVLTDREIFGEKETKTAYTKLPDEGIDRSLLVELSIGDYVVHENHGVGIYRGLERLAIDGIGHEYIEIEYAAGDKLFVPLSQMGLVGKYSSSESYVPKINRMGGREWGSTKKKAAKDIEDMTRDLLELYSTREVLEGHSFPPDTPWQGELEGSFPYDETPDQEKAIRDVKFDMESAKPMDRLLCGDVGYGKTEVALRAAFKAAASGKQVAVLVPTTILAEQHFNNFKERFAPFPVKVEMLSRFRSKEEQRDILQKLALGEVDAIIGTHRLLQKDVKFADLGLVIVDEEQRFGVKHKEKLKNLKKSVDVLTMTATPIPRTLYFSLSGARDMSMIQTPPVDRSPVKTYVMEWSDHVVKQAISRELERGGQVYYVYNHVEGIERVAERLRDLIPGARIIIAHGQMEEGQLEKTMMKFMERDFDILVCTTIIESGIDIPTVNTIIIDQANIFGLAQLYQLRGRVGRSPVRAFAYLLYHKEDLLTGGALERLEAIKEFTSLGSGYRLALRDLEIRGAGNLLGREQHGHMLALGFDLYCNLIEAAVNRAKGLIEVSAKEVLIELKIDAYIPDDFISDERQRIAYYKRMNLFSSSAEVKDISSEIEDRFGKLPREVLNLVEIIKLKVNARQCGIKKIEEKEGVIAFEFFGSKDKELIKINKGEQSVALARAFIERRAKKK